MILKDKVAVVTGGTRGIGRAIALELAREGADVSFTYLKSAELAESLTKEIESLGRKAVASKIDVKDFEAGKELIKKTIDSLGKLDILVNNAGITKDKALMLMDKSEWQEVIETNLTGVFNVTRAAIITLLKQKSGDIINISSVSGQIGLPRQTNYSASKAGVLGFTKALAKEVGAYGVRVNAIAAGFIDTDMTRDLKPELKEQMLKRIPLSRFGRAEEVAKVAMFLLTNSYITGQTITIDGGLAIR